jgi:Flp pilus assembly protein TadG
MRRLMRRVRGRNVERGAVAALVAILLTTGVMVGMGAVVVDAGNLYAERAQMQSGADAAALAIAQACSSTPTGAACASDLTNLSSSARVKANGYAISNANDLSAHIKSVCGSGAAAITTPCTTDPTCPSTNPSGNFVRVHTQTGIDSSSTLIPPAFGKTLLGGSYNGKTVGACAQTTWGPPAKAPGLALTISYCEWIAYVGGDDQHPVYQQPPPYVPPATAEIVIYFHDTNPNPTHCIAGPSGFDVPGDFGSTQDDTSNCNTTFNFDASKGTTTYNSQSGASLSGACQTALFNAQQSKAVVFLPIYDGVTGTGGNGTYTLWHQAAFVITGFYWPSWKAKSYLSNSYPCGENARCISGYFTTGTQSGTPGSGTGAGASAAGLTG